MGQTTWERRERREKAGMFSNEKDKDWKNKKDFASPCDWNILPTHFSFFLFLSSFFFLAPLAPSFNPPDANFPAQVGILVTRTKESLVSLPPHHHYRHYTHGHTKELGYMIAAICESFKLRHYRVLRWSGKKGAVESVCPCDRCGCTFFLSLSFTWKAGDYLIGSSVS